MIQKIGGIFIVSHQRKVLVCNINNHWTIPLGFKKDNEEVLESAFKATLEQTGYNLKEERGDLRYLGMCPYDEGDKILSGYAFFLHYLHPKTSKNNSDIKIDGYAWMNYDSLLENIHYTQTELIKSIEPKMKIILYEDMHKD